MSTGPQDDYYALLGIAANADPAQVRRAWWRLAIRWHPDRSGSRTTKIFQQLQAAYAVLSDPVSRAEYDRQRGFSAGSPPRAAPAILLRRLSGPLNSLLASGAVRKAEKDIIELRLNVSEAAGGGMVMIAMRVPVRCSACADNALAPCAHCGDARIVSELFSAWLAVPPGVVDGTMLTPSATLPGMIRPVLFRVRRP